MDFGKPAELLMGNRYLLENNNVKMEDYEELNITTERSHIKNPIYIGRNAQIINSILGPYVSIGEDAFIENCILENSVIESKVYLKNIISKNSIIGSNVKVENICKENLIIGDKSVY